MNSARPDAILLFDGVFLLRPELRTYWDCSVYLEISFETSLRRALQRDRKSLGDEKTIRERYYRRYIPGQKLYLENCQPDECADFVINHNQPQNPIVLKSHNVCHYRK